MTEPFAPGTLIAAGIGLLGLEWPTPRTTFVESAGAFTGRCSRAGGAHVLRIASAPGTPVPRPSPTPEWGLHLVDANIAQARPREGRAAPDPDLRGARRGRLTGAPRLTCLG